MTPLEQIQQDAALRLAVEDLMDVRRLQLLKQLDFEIKRHLSSKSEEKPQINAPTG